MNRLAKRLYNIAPDPVTLTFADGSTVVLSMHSAEFFQDDLEAEGEVTVDDRTARTERSVQLSGERKYISVQLLFSDVSTGSQLPESVWARARVGYGGEMSDWHELTI